MLETLQVTWFLLIGVLLAGYSVLDGFDLGAGFWHLVLKKDEQRRSVLSAIAPVWDGNEVWLLTGGGAIFAAFPPVYASVFSAFYLALMLVLYGLIFRAVSLEVRNKMESGRWRGAWDWAFGIGSLLPALLFGVALGNVARGLPLDAQGNYTGSFFDLLNPYSLVAGVTGLALFVQHGLLYLLHKSDGELHKTLGTWTKPIWVVTTLLYSAMSIISLTYLPQIGSLLLAIVGAALAVVAMMALRLFSQRNAFGKALIASGAAIIFNWGAIGAVLYPNLVPASDPAFSLTLFNSSSSELTLGVMALLALVGMPLVIGYTIYVYRIFRGKTSSEGYY